MSRSWLSRRNCTRSRRLFLEQFEDRALLSSCPAIGAIDATGEKDLYSFTLASRSRLYFDSQTNSSSLNWSLAGPAGPVVSGRSFAGSDSNDLANPVLDLVAGNYTLAVDGTGDATGPYKFGLCDLASANSITPGTPFSGQLNPGNETDFYSFNVSAGDKFMFDAQTVSSSNGRARLIDPYDNIVMDTGLDVDVASIALNQPGTYVLLVEGRINQTTPIDYTYNMAPLGNTPPPPLTGAALTLGTVVSDSISAAGEQDPYIFTLATDSRLAFDALTNSGSLNWSLVGPSGLVINQRPFTNSDSFDIGNPVVNVPAGKYQLTVAGTSGFTGAYQFRLLDLASATSITPGTPVSGTLDPATETDLYRFTAAAGDKFFFDVQTGIGNATWRLVDPFSNILFFSGFNSDVNTLTLAQAGTYTLMLEGRRDSGSSSVAYAFNVQPVTDGNSALTIGATVAGAIDETGEQDHYAFTLATAARLVFDTLTNNSNINWSLVGPAGLYVDQRAFTNSDSFDNGNPLVSLPAGNYTLTVDGVGDTTGAYQFRLLDLAAATAITPGTPVSGTLDPATETDLYRFTAAADEKFFFDVQTGIGNATWRLVDPFSNILFFSGFNSDVNTLTLAQAGTYTLMLEGRRDSGSGSAAYMFNVQPVTDGNSTLTIGATVAGAIDETGEQDHYTFALATATRLVFDSLTNNSSINWSLVSSAGLFVDQRAFTNSDSFDNGYPLVNLPAGNYTLTVDGVGDATGAYQFRLLDFASATAITPGTPVSGTLDPAIETDLYRLTAAAGDQFFFDVQTGVSNATWRLVDPFGNIVFSTSLNSDVNTLTLAQAGTYTLMLEGRRDSGSGSAAYAFNVQPVTDGNSTLTIGATVAGTIDETGEQDHYTFTLAAATRLAFDSLTNNSNINWSLVGPAGLFVDQRAFTNSDSFDNAYPLVNLPAGNYTLTVDGVGDTTGAYQFRLLDLASATAITPGTPASGTLDPATETDLYRFTAAAGDQFFFDVQTGISNATWRLVDPFSNIVFSTSLNSDVNTLTLTQAGTYTLMLEGRRDAGSGSAAYAFNVQPVTDGNSTLTIGATASGTIDETGEKDHYTFTLAAATRLAFDSQTNNNNINWSLVGPAGLYVDQRQFAASDSFDGNPLLNLPPGNYTLTVDGVGDATGPYQFRLLDLASATAITPGTPVTDTLDPATETDLYSFTAAAGDQFSFDEQTGISNANWRLVDPFNNILFSQSFNSDVNTLTLTQAGTYTIMLEGRRDAGTGSAAYMFNVQPMGNTPQSPFTGTALTLGSTVSDSISAAGEEDDYTFTLAGATRLYFDSLTNNGSIQWSIVGPAGTAVSNRSFPSSDANDIGNPVISVPAGSYQLRVFGSGSATGAYSFRLSNLDTAGAANAITPGTPFSGQLNPGNETDFFSFTATAGQMFYFDVQSATSGNGKVRLIDPFTNVVLDTALNTDVDTFTLAQGGTYIGLIEGRFNESSPSSYTYNLQPISAPVPTALTLGTTTSGAISPTGETDVYTFSLPSVSRLYFDSQTNNNNFNWTLVGPTGTIVNHRSFLGSDSNDLGNPVLSGLPAGSYTLTIDGTTDNTGAYSFRLSDLDAAGAANAITPGTPFSGQLNPGNETDFFSFTATAGQMFYFDVQSATSGNGHVRLIDPFANVVLDTALSTDVDTFTLTQGGTYIGLIEGRYNETSPSSYTYNLQPVPAPVPTALTLGTTTSGAISLTGETDVYTFSLASASRLYFDSLTNNNNFNWTLVGPAGTVVSHRSFLGSDSNDLGNPVLGGLPAGSYTLTIDGTTDNTGAYSFRLSNVDTAGAANAITPGTPFSGQLNPGNETDFFSFTANAGQMFYFDVQSATSGNGKVRLIDPFANVVLDTGLSTDVDTFILPQGGTYIGLIEGRYNESSPSSYTYNLQPVPAPTPTALTLGTTTSGAISLTGETDVYTFSLASVSRLYFDALTNNNNFNWTLVGPTGTVVSHRSFLGSDSNDLGNPVLGGLPAGSYTLTIDGTTDNTGAYSFRLSNVDTAGAANAITPGTPFSGQLNPGNETDFFSFTATAGQMFYFDVQSATSGNGKVRLIDPFTNVVLDTALSTDVDTFTLTQGGTYFGLIEGRYNESSSSSYTYNLQPLVSGTPLSLLSAGFSITPTSGLVTTEAGGTATFTVVLCTQPTADVTISLTSSDTTEGQVSPTSLTFTHDNYNIAQTVTVTGVNDDDVDGDIAYTIITGSAVSADSAYNGIDPPDVSVTNKNDDLFCSTVVINTNDAGAGSLREAINCANSTLGTDPISFNIPGSGVHTISPLSALPAITDPVIIDGYTQPGASPNTNGPKQADNANLLIELDGSNAGTGKRGFDFQIGSAASTVRGLVINHFASGVFLASNNNVIAGNLIGNFPPAAVHTGTGVVVSVGSNGNRIGGTDADDGAADGQLKARNVISGGLLGVSISGSTNLIEGNLIGTQPTGLTALYNVVGVLIQAGSNNIIGGSAFGAGNVISGNQLGIDIENENDPTSSNVVQGNLIGTDVTGTTNLANTGDGIDIDGPNNLIGGTASGMGNVIAFNTGTGILVQFDSAVANSILGNSIYQNVGLGIDLNDDGPTPNDLTLPTDSDTGPNNVQNFPVIKYATRDAGKLKVTYNVPSAPANSTYPIRVEFFLADANGQGKTYLGFDTFTTGDFAASGKTVTFTTAAPAKVLDKIVATATDSLTAAPGSPPANTSEFSPSATIVSPWQNPGRLRWDVNDDTFVSADDVLAIINYINAKGSGLLPDDAKNEKPFLDVDSDNNVVAADVIDIINYINAGRRLGGEAEGESDQLPATSGSFMPGNDVMALLAADVAAEAVRKRRG